MAKLFQPLTFGLTGPVLLPVKADRWIPVGGVEPGVLSAARGTFNFTGAAANLEFNREVVAGGGTFAFTGSDATLTYTPILDDLTLSAEGASFVFTGDEMIPVVDYQLPMVGGTFAFSGAAASVEFNREIVGGSATFAFSGTDATLTHDAGSSALSTPTITDFYAKTGTPAPGIEETVDIGPATADRVVFITVALYGEGDSVNVDFTCKINNNAATPAGYMRTPGGSFPRHAAAVFILNVPSGTTATVEIDGYTNGWVNSYAVQVGYFTGSATASVVGETESLVEAGGDDPTSVTCPADGLVLISAILDRNVSDPATTWTNATEMGTTMGSGVDQCWHDAAYMQASASVTLACTNNNVSGWVAARIQP